MRVVALVQHQIIPVARVLAGEGQHLSALQFMRLQPLHKVAGRDHQVAYVGYYQFEQSRGIVINKKSLRPLLESLLRYVPSLFGQTSPDMQYQFKVSVCAHSWIVTGCEHPGVLRSFTITDIAQGALGNDESPIFYLCDYGWQGYADMLEAIKRDYNVDSVHLKEAKCQPGSMADGSNIYSIASLGQTAIADYRPCDICTGGALRIFRDNRKIKILPPSAPPSPARVAAAALNPQQGNIQEGEHQPLRGQLPAKHPQDCCCFHCSCCSVS